ALTMFYQAATSGQPGGGQAPSDAANSPSTYGQKPYGDSSVAHSALDKVFNSPESNQVPTTLLGKIGNAISKMHDAWNSWMYNATNTQVVRTGFTNTTFEATLWDAVYSVPGMVPSAVVTGAAYLGQYATGVGAMAAAGSATRTGFLANASGTQYAGHRQ
ncbi:MAG TPA: hypothetical protein VGQ83_35110, partial [Polyangia bacterium]